MILVDANILLYAYHPRAAHHQTCRAWVEETFSAVTPIGLPWLTIWAFLRISTNPNAFEKPLKMSEAVEIVRSWIEIPIVVLLLPGERHWKLLQELLLEAQVRGPLVTDAVLAALALEHGAAVCTTDRDFARFEQLKIIDPTRNG